MSVLEEDRCYGLRSGKVSLASNQSVFHVKLTDSAARAISSLQDGKGCALHPSICFNGSQGRITIPCSDNKDEVRIFTFSVANVARSSPHGSFDCIRQFSNSAAEELSCLGVIQKKMTINATDDSYDKARQSMAQAEEETRSRGTIVIKNGGRYQGKKVTVRAPAPALAKLTKPKHSSHSLLSNIRRRISVSKKSPCPSNGKSGDVVQRPLRERIMHVLALRPYKRPELILRLQRDGLTGEEKDGLESALSEVAQLSGRDNTFVLKESFYKDLRKDWPGYTPGDQQLLKRVLVRRLFQPQQNLLTVPKAQVSPLRDTPNSSPAHRFKHSLVEDFTDVSTSKKPRISHLSNKSSCKRSLLTLNEQGNQRDTEGKAKDERWDSLDAEKLLDSLLATSNEETAKRLEPTESAQQASEGHATPQPNRSPSLVSTPDLQCTDQKGKEREKLKHILGWKTKKERRKDLSSDDESTDATQACTELNRGSDDAEAYADMSDYLSKYTSICSHSQRQSYKQDFNKEYSEYRDLHARIDHTTRQFLELESQLKQLHRGSLKYKTVHNKILQKYRKIKKSNPSYNQDKVRCEYLHNKLAHIKKLISDFDQQQLTADRSCPE
ncbi:RNA polymerase II elongation factor ELL isoform X2 [Oryzias latipes]|uniref:RNA polymerase II elongation factor ELL isoform X2 n=1 Tax=Oryzias latipes TaxID=8090 RepID=UPI0009DB24ED|nr:RNA polymerase II elongation factor ELL isoform X2 [Oryzias latipes]